MAKLEKVMEVLEGLEEEIWNRTSENHELYDEHIREVHKVIDEQKAKIKRELWQVEQYQKIMKER